MWFVGQSVSVIGTWLQNTGQAWLVLKLTNSPQPPENAILVIMFERTFKNIYDMLHKDAG